jgi:hypothetical protein
MGPRPRSTDLIGGAAAATAFYIGDRQFVHAPATGGAVRVERIDQQYWNRRFDGARRLLAFEAQADRGRDPLSRIVSPGRSQPSPQSRAAAAAGGDTASARPGSPAPASRGRLTIHELDSIGGN